MKSVLRVRDWDRRIVDIGLLPAVFNGKAITQHMVSPLLNMALGVLHSPLLPGRFTCIEDSFFQFIYINYWLHT
ncbi:hypothetical protein [Micromonospora sp. NPDC050695]|uniref:hypothetical protein n=1 Tax=Micromonospora sp. NPDC050695 TaxID=3154938 RepID=UPI0033DED8A6